MQSKPSYPKALVLAMVAFAFALLAWAAMRWSLFLGPLPPGAGITPFLPVGLLMKVQPSWVHPISWLCIAAAIISTGVLALFLLRTGKENRPAAHLAAATGTCAALLAYWCFVIPLRLWPASAMIAADIGSGFLLSWLLQRLMFFSCEFPRPVDLDAMHQWARAQQEVKDGKLPAWLTRYRKIGASTTYKLVHWQERNASRFVSFLLSRRGWLVLGGLFALSHLFIRVGLELPRPMRVVMPLGIIGLLCPVIICLALIADPLHWNMRTGTEADRRKIFWIFWGVMVSNWTPWVIFWASLFATAFGSEASYFLTVGSFLAGFPAAIFFTTVALAFAIFFQGALDPRLAISRTSVIGLFGMVLPPLILAGERFIQHGLLEQLNLPEHSTTWVFVGLTAVTFRPVSRRLEG